MFSTIESSIARGTPEANQPRQLEVGLGEFLRPGELTVLWKAHSQADFQLSIYGGACWPVVLGMLFPKRRLGHFEEGDIDFVGAPQEIDGLARGIEKVGGWRVFRPHPGKMLAICLDNEDCRPLEATSFPNSVWGRTGKYRAPNSARTIALFPDFLTGRGTVSWDFPYTSGKSLRLEDFFHPTSRDAFLPDRSGSDRDGKVRAAAKALGDPRRCGLEPPETLAIYIGRSFPPAKQGGPVSFNTLYTIFSICKGIPTQEGRGRYLGDLERVLGVSHQVLRNSFDENRELFVALWRWGILQIAGRGVWFERFSEEEAESFLQIA